jgi:hypothetical protein
MLSPNRLTQAQPCKTVKKIVFGLFLTGILLCTLSYVAVGDVNTLTSQEWQIEDRGGYYSESDGIIRLRSSGGDICPGFFLYKQVAPTTDFKFSLQVTAATLESFLIFVRSSLPIGWNTEGVNFEFGHYGAGTFLLVRCTSTGHWIGSHFADGDADVWYTMQLSVYANPFRIVAEVLAENGTLLASTSASDMSNISFDDIKYLGFGVWGYGPTDYSVRGIIGPFDNAPSNNPAYISISTELSSAIAGSAVNVIGTLSDLNRTPLPGEVVVLSYTFAGIDYWIPISSSLTNEAGEYNIQWINSASGTFTLKTEWDGNAAFTGISNTTTLSFVPYQSQQVLFVESNSTVTALAFNSTSSELSFTVIGPSDTSGYVKATISKNITANGADIKVYLDGNQLNYSVISTDDSWLITFSYSHSTHNIIMQLGANTSSTAPLEFNYVLWAVIVTLTFAGAIIGLVIRKRRKKIHTF